MSLSHRLLRDPLHHVLKSPSAMMPRKPNLLGLHQQQQSLTDSLSTLPNTIHRTLEQHGTLKPQRHADDSLATWIRNVRLTRDEMRKYAHWDITKRYTRNLVATDHEHYTLLLMCWNPGRESPIHNHPGDGCWMKVCQGTIQESRYVIRDESNELDCVLDNHYKENQTTFIQDSLGYHKVGNPSFAAPAVTLHLYCPPLAECKVFTDPTNASLTKQRSTLAFDSEYGKAMLAGQ